ncbi:hypothetical protein Tco_1483845 [Tanacetum coccineum]
MSDSIGGLVSLGDEIFSEGKESRELNIDGGTIAGRATITWGVGIVSYACMFFICRSSCKGEKTRKITVMILVRDRCPRGKANEMWIAIERLQQGESLNVQDVRQSVWEFGKVYCLEMENHGGRITHGLQLMNELTRNQLPSNNNASECTNFLQQLQPESSSQHELMIIRAEESQRVQIISTHCAKLKPYQYLLSEPKPKDQMQHHLQKPSASPDTKAKRSPNHNTPPSESVFSFCMIDSDPTSSERLGNAQVKLAISLQSITRSSTNLNQPTTIETFFKPPGTRLRKIPQQENRLKRLDEQELVQNHNESNVYDNVRRHSEQPESINDTYVLEKDDSNVTPDSSNICTNDNQVDQNAAECVDERVALANLIANLTLDTEENKMILKQLKKANASLTQELEKCKTNLDETNSALGETISCRDSCLIALQTNRMSLRSTKPLMTGRLIMKFFKQS